MTLFVCCHLASVSWISYPLGANLDSVSLVLDCLCGPKAKNWSRLLPCIDCVYCDRKAPLLLPCTSSTSNTDEKIHYLNQVCHALLLNIYIAAIQHSMLPSIE